jgi:hypothetical protein
MRLMAGPESTGCVMAAETCAAPASLSARAASVSVPAVSTMSSTMTQERPSTSPTMFITSAMLAASRRLSTIARLASRRFA